MIRSSLFALLVGFTLASTGSAQTGPWRFQWTGGDVLTYRVDHVITTTEVVSGEKSETIARLTNIKRWQVLGVDAQGVATVQLSFNALRIEQTTETTFPQPDKPAERKVTLFDSANPGASNPEMVKELAKFVGTPVATLRVDSKGRVVEVKSAFGPPSRFESDLPFVVCLPDIPTVEGQTWERNYAITLEAKGDRPAQKFDTVQQYICKSVQGGVALIGMTTMIKTLPPALADQVPLLDAQPEGEIVFNTLTGRLLSAQFKVNKELKNHQGEGSRYLLQSTYSEQQVPN